MEHPYESLPDNPQAAITILTTEHFNLQTARAATISESNGRTSIFLGAVSAGLVALAFAGQTSRTTLLTFGLVLFPVLSFLGLVTFERVLQASIEDTLYLQRINRIRRFYHRAAPGLSGYLGVAAPTDDIVTILALDGYSRSRRQILLSAVGMIGVINSVLLGTVAGFGAAAITESLWPAILVAVVVFGVATIVHQRYQLRARHRKPNPFADAPPP
ncbi:hypothetical protein ACIBL3_39510 [Kribbella sp. NPDC050124]|uniref:hypothetical protein n=1 Tax=Kribbella sp. NPDC050124 TaxID=3364114 RepID=UPI00378EA1F8